MKPVEREAKNRLLAITPPAPLCFTFHSLPLLLLLIFLPLFYRSASLSSIMPPSTLIIKILYFIHILLGLCKLQQSRLCFVCKILRCKGRHSPPLRLCWRRLSQVSSLLCVCVCSCVCLMCVLHQLRQVSQAKRWDDVGTGRRTIRQSRLIESLDFPDEDLGVNLGIVSVWEHADSVCVCVCLEGENKCRIIHHE